MIIYKVTNKTNGKVYIGQTKHDLQHRKSGHERDTLSRRKHSTYFHEALAKYGFDNFVWEVIAESDTQDEIDELEKKYIAEYNATDRNYGYNLKLGGKEGGLYNDECRRRLGESTKKKWTNPDTAAKMLAGLRKGTETVKRNAENYWEERVCPECGKTFKVKPHEKKKHCSVECGLSANKKYNKLALIRANEVEAEEWEKNRKIKCKKLIEWVNNHKDIILNAKFNHLTFIKEIGAFIGVKDERTVAKVIGLNYRREFVLKLQEMINSDGSEKCSCGGKIVNVGKYRICMECGDSWTIE